MKFPIICTRLGVMILGLATGVHLAAANDSLVTAVFSQTSKFYHREKQPDGTFKPETYVVAEGGYQPGAAADASIEHVKFPDIIRSLSGFLARQNYLPTRAGNSPDLLLVVYWGTTRPFSAVGYQNGLDITSSALNRAQQSMQAAMVNGAIARSSDGIQSPAGAIATAARNDLEGALIEMQFMNNSRLKAIEQDARVLGYVDEINRVDSPARLAGLGTHYDDLISDLEEERYYVIVSAYDYKVAAQQKQRKILWTTRVSIRAQGEHFDRSLNGMFTSAAASFGRNNGFRRRYLGGVVELGELKVMGIVPESAPPQKPEPVK